MKKNSHKGKYYSGSRRFNEYGPEDHYFPEPGTRPHFVNDWRDRERFIGDEDRWFEAEHGQRMIQTAKNFFGVGPKGYHRSDARIQEDACDTLYRDPDVDASEIEVEVKDGTVILRGSVESRWMKKRAENCVEHIPGVEDVRNEITIDKTLEKRIA